MMYLLLVVMGFYVFGCILFISLKILDIYGVKNFYWKFILTIIGNLGVINGTLIGNFIMAQALEWFTINYVI
jgi:hypothetical protein